MTIHLTCRHAMDCDADAVASVFSPSFRLLTFLPMLHTVEEHHWFISNVILKECDVTVAESDGAVVSFLARRDEEIRLLYTHPQWLGTGAGTRLIELAKRADVNALELWCFQANARARKFYEKLGFRPVYFTDGQRNEEKTPDVRYRWEKARGGI